MITALIDGDWILYAAGFAGQKNELVCPNLYGQLTFKTATSIKEHLVADGIEGAESPVYMRYVLDDESHFYHSAKQMIVRNREKIEEKLKERVKPVVLIAGDGNFRCKLATIRPYKGQRHVHAKPLMYNSIRQYLLDNWNAEVVHNQETDDEMAIRQTASGTRSIIVSIDKDMLQVRGWHMNPNKGFKYIDATEAQQRLYVQCIQGDSTDNIGGAYKCGPVTARKIITRNMKPWAAWDATVVAYRDSMEKYGSDIYKGLTASEAALENMRLVYLRRTPGELWTPPEED